MNNGGPAFPSDQNQVFWSNSGLSVRDYFAGQALASLAAVVPMPREKVAKAAYEIADAMLKARDEMK